MIIREGNKFDINNVLQMVKTFVETSNLNDKIKENIDYTYVNQLYHHCILGGGLVLLAIDDDKIVGMIAGIKSPNIWMLEDISLREIMFYVDPFYRNGRTAYKLIKEYNNKAQEMLDKQIISSYTMTKTEHLDQIDYSRFGYNKVEETWAVGM
jgi:GNAT superfamily N-acetyltransferase